MSEKSLPEIKLGTTAWKIAIALCDADWCHCEDEDLYPCRVAQRMAKDAEAAIAEAGIESWKLDQLAGGDYILCDGYCRE